MLTLCWLRTYFSPLAYNFLDPYVVNDVLSRKQIRAIQFIIIATATSIIGPNQYTQQIHLQMGNCEQKIDTKRIRLTQRTRGR